MVRGRLGVVLTLPAAIAAEVDGLRRALGDERVDAVPPHVTLVPPVNVGVHVEDEALALARDAAAATPAIAAVIGPAATFWPVNPVAYLSVHAEGDGLQRLHRALQGGPWSRPTTWAFVPHVTIAPGMDAARIPAAVELLAAFRAPATLSCLRVMREAPDGSWAHLEDIELAARHVVGRGGLEVTLETGATLGPEAQRLAGTLGHDPSRFAVTARREGVVAGAAEGVIGDRALWLERLVVDPAARHHGVGHHLLRAVEALGATRGCLVAYAVCPASSPAVGWLSSHGWRQDLTLPGWLPARDYVRLARAV
ncbi:MAG TPA: GNAT family N-acetyltransferase [Acidimicrobiales bacterium]|nr:GNAT family N-acetyltransferase [Acidimicrobiales bacterium]